MQAVASIDNRRIRIGIEINGILRHYENLAITATGQKFANANQGECNITISNLERSVSDFILTETSPHNRNRTRVPITVEAGRVSTGLSVLYRGDIFRSDGGTRPDNLLSIRCLTGQFQKGNIIERTGLAMDSLRAIAQGVADDNDLSLQFTAAEKTIANYSFSGASIKQVEKLREISGADVFVDGNVLVVKPINAPIDGSVFLVNSRAGLQVPQFTEQGLKASFLYDPRVKLGSTVQIESEQFPATNGQYVIYRLQYSIANRDAPFHYTMEGRRI